MLSQSNKFYKFLLLFSIYLTYNWINFFYVAENNVDFYKYFDYLNYFLGLDVSIDFGQGTFYYFIISRRLLRKIENIDLGNLEFIISSSVHEVNLILFLIGLIGVYKVLKHFEFEKNLIYFTLILFIYFPQSIYMRSVMKPEIFAFSLFPWCIYFLEKFLKHKDIKYLYLTAPFLALILNSKASLAAMTLIYFLIFYYEVFKHLKLKKLFLTLSFFLVIYLPLQFENYIITGLTPLERVYDEEYDYKATFDILYRLNLYEIIQKPIFDYNYEENYYSIHAKSIINMTLLDTFGDYYNQLFDFKGNYFSQNRKDIFISYAPNLITNSRQINYNGPLSSFLINKLDYLRKYISVLFSFVFYIGIIYFGIKLKKFRKFFLAPFVGIIVLYINALGFPSNNFNPYKGDTFKAFYYSFLLSIAFCFYIINIIKKNKFILNLLFSIIFIISIFFIAGHPKNNDQMMSERIVAMNEFNLFCEFNKVIFLENQFLKKIHPSGNESNYKSNCNYFETSELFFERDFETYKNEKFQLCYYDDYLIKDISNTDTCRIFWIRNAQKLEVNNNLKPFFATFLFFVCIFIILFDSNKKIKFINNI